MESVKNTNQTFWNRVAQENPFHYIATSRKDWTSEEFLQDGEWRVHKWVLPWLLSNGLDPKKTTFLEIGCGAGRFGIHIAKVVKKYIGLDISERNIELFKAHLSSFHNVELIVSDGHSLKEVPDSSIDAVFSYAVLQHVWEKEVVLSYLRETMRVLSGQGMAKHHMAGSNRVSGFKMRHTRVQTLGNSRVSSRLLKKFLPADFLIWAPMRYRSGTGLQGEGICYKEAMHFLASSGFSVRVEPFENHNLASRYWLLFAKRPLQGKEGGYE